jgi:hypothetical protein
VEVIGSRKHSSLLRYGNNYCRKKFYSTGPSIECHFSLCLVSQLSKYYDECHNDECHYAENCYDECYYAEYHYAECQYAECRNDECHYAEYAIFTF